MSYLKTSSLIWACTSILLTSCDARKASIEVVENVPVETNLAVKGIRTTPQVWVEMINGAKKSIDLEEFYICNKSGEALDPVLAAIKSAVKRGVAVRLLIDDSFFKKYRKDVFDLMNGLQVRVVDYSPSGGIQHSKYFVVDRNDSFVGSANFDWVALTHVHEVGLRIKDARVGSDLEDIFAKDWKIASAIAGVIPTPQEETSKKHAAHANLKVVGSPPSSLPEGVSDTLHALVNLIGTAHRSVQIQVYEYNTKIPKSSEHWNVLDGAIREAAARGVKVQLIVDKTALKQGSADLKALAQLPDIQVKLVTIPEWSGGHIPFARLVHSKYCIIDHHTAWVGSENWSANYFTSSRNVGVTVRVGAVTKSLSHIFDTVWNSTYTSAP